MKESSEQGLAEIRSRWQRVFEALHRGDEVPPGVRLRTEGVMEALVLLGLVSEADLQESMSQVYQQVFGRSPEQEWGEDWKDLFPFPQIPGFGVRAPVYPSTRD